MNLTTEQVARFWAKVDKSGACWLWKGAHLPKGYGTLTVNGRTAYAHRVSYLLHHDRIPQGLQVLHRCDTPACVRPDHLFVGTAADNSADMTYKGRSINRQPGPRLFIGPNLVRIRRQRDLTQADIAKCLGYSVPQTCRIEKNCRPVCMATVRKLAAALSVPTDELTKDVCAQIRAELNAA